MRTEKIAGGIFLIAVIMKFLHLSFGNALLIISAAVLGIIYFLGFYFFRDEQLKKQNVVMSVISGLLLSCIPVGVLFKLMYWPGADFNLLIGLVAAPVIGVIAWLLKKSAPDELKRYYRRMLGRSVILSLVVSLFYFISTETLLKAQYRNDPELARLKYLHYQNPQNPEYKKQHDDYIKRSKQ